MSWTELFDGDDDLIPIFDDDNDLVADYADVDTVDTIDTVDAADAPRPRTTAPIPARRTRSTSPTWASSRSSTAASCSCRISGAAPGATTGSPSAPCWTGSSHRSTTRP